VLIDTWVLKIKSFKGQEQHSVILGCDQFDKQCLPFYFGAIIVKPDVKKKNFVRLDTTCRIQLPGCYFFVYKAYNKKNGAKGLSVPLGGHFIKKLLSNIQ
jgi:hypothetical protein